jgi:hypothetical protein
MPMTKSYTFHGADGNALTIAETREGECVEISAPQGSPVRLSQRDWHDLCALRYGLSWAESPVEPPVAVGISFADLEEGGGVCGPAVQSAAFEAVSGDEF